VRIEIAVRGYLRFHYYLFVFRFLSIKTIFGCLSADNRRTAIIMIIKIKIMSGSGINIAAPFKFDGK
jgi:hypothetical protein